MKEIKKNVQPVERTMTKKIIEKQKFRKNLTIKQTRAGMRSLNFLEEIITAKG
jgi:hypothetical protein